MNRRPTHAAGYSWRKWEDPIQDAVTPVPLLDTTLYWLVCVVVGALAALLVFG